MYCKNCGKEIEENSRFCSSCGEQTSNAPKPEDVKETTDRKSKSKIILLAAVLAFICIGAFFAVRAFTTVKDAVVEEPVAHSEDLSKDESSDKDSAFSKEVSEYLNNYISDNLIMTETEKSIREEKIKELNDALDKKDFKILRKAFSELKALDTKAEDSSLALLSEKVNHLRSINQSTTLDAEKDLIQGFDDDAAEQIKAKNYAEAKRIVDDWENLANGINKASEFHMSISQFDVSEFPKIKLYLSILNPSSGAFFTGASLSSFSLMEKSIGEYKTIKPLELLMLNQAEKLKIGLVADISGSMEMHFGQVKQVMNSFINNVKFDKGDQVSLISFDNYVYNNVPFTSDKQKLMNSVDSLALGASTALYDALYVAVSTTAAQSGARYVVAFTDGIDNYSTKTPDDVIRLANAYKIPIFIIGIGSELQESALYDIANGSGGSYQNVALSINSIELIFDKIYEQQKEMYMLSYETDAAQPEDILRSLYISYDDKVMMLRSETEFIVSELKTVPEDYIAILERSSMSGQEVEDEVLRIRALWNTDKAGVDSNQYGVKDLGNGTKAYYNSSDLRMIIVPKGTNGSPYQRTYEYSNGKLIFAYLEDSDAHRLYFKNDSMFRWRYATEAAKRDESTNYDNLSDSPMYRELEDFARKEAYALKNSADNS